MNGNVFEPSGHEGISLVRDQKGNVIGYFVDGEEFTSLAKAIAWRDADRAPPLPEPPAPKRGRSR